MPPLFPGMNPYLEDPNLWPEVHAWLIVQLARSLNPVLAPKYRAAVERLTELVKERYLEIRRVGTGEVVTVVEVLSPANKRSGEGRNKYNAKRKDVLDSLSNFVEIDLLRAGDAQPMSGYGRSHYRVLVSRAGVRPKAELYPFNVQDPVPVFSLPLRAGDVEPVITLQTLLHEIYDEALLDLAIDYSQPVPSHPHR